MILKQSFNPSSISLLEDAPADAIKELKVGEHDAVLVTGMWVVCPGENQFCWAYDGARYRLRWQEGKRWFELDATGTVLNLQELDDLLEHAVNLVDEAQLEDGPRTDYLANRVDIQSVFDFDFLTPAVMPESWHSTCADYFADSGILEFHYEPIENGGFASWHLAERIAKEEESFFEGLRTNSEHEMVGINGFTGYYRSVNKYRHEIYWKTGEIFIRLYFSADEDFNGGILSKDQFLQIARSIR